MENNPEQNCPVCNCKTFYSERYPKHLCSNCIKKITDKAGRGVSFYNSEWLGYGCQGRYNDDQKDLYETNICYINGIECYAQEAYFGGIIIQAK